MAARPGQRPRGQKGEKPAVTGTSFRAWVQRVSVCRHGLAAGALCLVDFPGVEAPASRVFLSLKGFPQGCPPSLAFEGPPRALSRGGNVLNSALLLTGGPCTPPLSALSGAEDGHSWHAVQEEGEEEPGKARAGGAASSGRLGFPET